MTNLGSQPPATWPTFLKLYGQKAAGAAAAASLAIWPVLPELVRHWFYALCLSMTLGALWDFWCCMAVAFAGIPVRMCVWWGGGAELGEKMRGLASAGIWVCFKGPRVVGGQWKGGDMLCLSMTLGALWDFWCCMAVAFAGIPVRQGWGGGVGGAFAGKPLRRGTTRVLLLQ